MRSAPADECRFQRPADYHISPPLQFPQPRLLLEAGAWLLHTETELILKSRKVHPARLLAVGFEFEYPECAAAVGKLLGVEAKTQKTKKWELKRAKSFESFIRVLGILLTFLGGITLIIPYVWPVFLPVALAGNVLILASSLSVRAKIFLVLFPYALPIALYTSIIYLSLRS